VIKFDQELPKDLKIMFSIEIFLYKILFIYFSFIPSVVDATEAAISLGTFSIRKLSNFLVSFSLILKNV